jgi:hypothetical protein
MGTKGFRFLALEIPSTSKIRFSVEEAVSFPIASLRLPAGKSSQHFAEASQFIA